MATYSFLSVQCSINGPNGSFSLGSSAAVAEEGITAAMTEEKNTMTIGAGGAGMHSLHGGNSGKLTVRLLKTSPTNAKLNAMYNADRQGAGTWGQNTIVVSDTVRGDVVTATQVAFSKQADLTYAKEGGLVEWEFMAIKLDELLGTGVPDVNL
jgi:hypothetical protein